MGNKLKRKILISDFRYFQKRHQSSIMCYIPHCYQISAQKSPMGDFEATWDVDHPCSLFSTDLEDLYQEALKLFWRLVVEQLRHFMPVFPCVVLFKHHGSWFYLNAARYSASPMGGSSPPVHAMLTLKPSPAPEPT